MNARILFAACGALLAAGCAHHYLPGTQIEETDDTTAIVKVMQQYRAAVEERNADKIVTLVAPGFHDDRGTAALDDDLDAQNLGPSLKAQFSRVENVHLNMDVRDIDVQDGTASAIYYYTLRYQMPGLTEHEQTNSELKKMFFQREGDHVWKIVSGI